jgi:hypothetical protein
MLKASLKHSKEFLFYIFPSIAVGSILQSLLLIYNKYPIILGDSPGYITRAFNGGISFHWSLVYSLFIKYSSFNISLVLVAIAQNLILSSLIFTIYHRTLFYPRRGIFFISTTLILSLFSGLPYISNLIMADVFTAIGILSIICFLCFTNNKSSILLLTALILFSAIAHTSNPPIFIVFLFLMLLLRLTIWCNSSLLGSMRFSIFTIALIFLIILTDHNYKKLIFHIVNTEDIESFTTLAKNEVPDVKYHFLWNQLQKTTMYQEFLNEYCDQKNWKYLCGNNTPKLGSPEQIRTLFHSNNEQFLKEIGEAGKVIFFNYRYLSYLLLKRTSNIYKLGVNNSIRVGSSNWILTNTLNQYLPFDAHILESSKSFSSPILSRYQQELLDISNSTIIYSSIIIIIYSMFFRRNVSKTNIDNIIICLFLGHLSNILLMGLFANEHNARYCYRTSWLLIIASSLSLSQIFTYLKTSKDTINKSEY